MANHPNRLKAPGHNPTPEEIRAKRERYNLTQTEASRLVYASLRAWQQWEMEIGSPFHRRMHAAFWELFLLKLRAARVKAREKAAA
jgi:hypothetical protein